MSNISNINETEVELIKQIELYKKRIKELEEENIKLYSHTDTNINPYAQSLVIYKDISNIYLYGEKTQLQNIAVKMSFNSYNSWEPCLKFNSIASVYTILLRNDFKFLYESKAHLSNESSYFIEVWHREY